MSSDLVFHLDELRKRILICLIAFAAAALACCFFTKQILEFFTWPLRQYTDTALYFQKPHEAFFVSVKAAAFAGFFFSLPVLLTQLWGFVSPALHPHEKKWFVPVVFASILLFFGGAIFAYGFVVPFGLQFLLSFQTENLKPILDISSYVSFLTGMLLAFGILFDFPVVLIGLVKLGVVSSRALTKSRKIAYVLIFVAAALLTPSPDPVSQCLLAFPLLFLFEVSLFIAKRIEAPKV